MTSRDRGGRGSASVLVLTLTAALTLLALLGSAGGSVLLTQRRAAAAADLAALAGAAALQRGDSPCPEAARLAAANGARLVRCEAGDEEVLLRVAREVDLPWGVMHDVEAAARAGPVG
jgi:secretion/DNA translocation related TadE-like protein